MDSCREVEPTGARKSEVLRWTWADDINFDERWVRLGTRKNRTGEMTYEKLWMNDFSLSKEKGLTDSIRKPLIFMAGATRLELATSGVTGRRSNQTELRPPK